MSDEERSEENTIIAMFNGIKDYFRNGTFCDLTIFGQEGDTLKGIKCHALVICSVAQALKHLFDNSFFRIYKWAVSNLHFVMNVLQVHVLNTLLAPFCGTRYLLYVFSIV